MTWVRATDRQIQAIKNLCYNLDNLRFIEGELSRLGKESLYQLDVGQAKEIIAYLLPRGRF